MRYVVCGSRPPTHGYTPAELRRVATVFEMFKWTADDSLGTGGCLGIDALAMRYGHACGMHIVTVLPRKDDFTDKAAVRLYSDEVIGTELGYWKRDEYEVAWGARVIALPLHERGMSSRLSGTWHTWDVAVEAGKAALLVVTRPVSEVPFVRGQVELKAAYRHAALVHDIQQVSLL